MSCHVMTSHIILYYIIYVILHYSITTTNTNNNNNNNNNNNVGQDRVVSIATRYGAGRSGDRISVGKRFSALVQTAPGVHPASCTMGTGSFPGVKRPGRGVGHPPHLVPRLKKE